MRIFYLFALLSLLFLAVQCGNSEKISDISSITGAGTEAITGGGTLTTQSGAPTVSNVALPTGVEDNVWVVLTFRAVDPQGDPFNYKIIYAPAPGIVEHIPAAAATATGAAVTAPTVSHQMKHSLAGTYVFNIEVKDNSGKVSVFGPYQLIVSQAINQVSAPLSATLVVPNVTKFVTGQPYTFSLNVTDPDGVGIKEIAWHTDEKTYLNSNSLSWPVTWMNSGTNKWVKAAFKDNLNRFDQAYILNLTVENAAAPPPSPAVSCATDSTTQFYFSVTGKWNGGITQYWWLSLDNGPFSNVFRGTLTGNDINTGRIAIDKDGKALVFQLGSYNRVGIDSTFISVHTVKLHWQCSDNSWASEQIYTCPGILPDGTCSAKFPEYPELKFNRPTGQ